MTSRRGSAAPIAPCYHAAIDTATGVFDLLLGDAGPAVVGDEIAGATTEQAMLAVAELGRLHGPLLGDTALAEAPWLNRESPLNQAMVTPLYAGFVGALRRPDRTGAPRGVRAAGSRIRRLPGTGGRRGRNSGPGARRLPAGQHAVRHRREPTGR